MNFRNTTPETTVYQASALLKANNSNFTAGDIATLLGVETNSELFHSVALGVWKANKEADTTRGYTRETEAV